MLPGARCCLATPSNSHFNGFLRLVISPEDLFRVQRRSDTCLFQLTHFSASPSCLGGFTSAVSVWMFGKSSLRWRLATMRFRFTKLPDAFKLCHHLFVSNTAFQKMSSLTVLGFFSVQLWDCKQIQALGWKCYSWEHQYNHVLPCDRSPLFAFGKWQEYQSTLGLRTHHLKPPRSLVYLVKLEVTITQSWLLF